MITGAGTRVLIGILSIWSPFINLVYFEREFASPAMIFSYLVSALLADAPLRDPLLSLNPARALTIEEHAAPDASLQFQVGAVLIPIILAYTAYA
jgi:cytochrome d ubiquinol oxidase subunit II